MVRTEGDLTKTVPQTNNEGERTRLQLIKLPPPYEYYALIGPLIPCGRGKLKCFHLTEVIFSNFYQ